MILTCFKWSSLFFVVGYEAYREDHERRFGTPAAEAVEENAEEAPAEEETPAEV